MYVACSGVRCGGNHGAVRGVLHVARTHPDAGQLLGELDAGAPGRRTRGGVPRFRMGLLQPI